MLLIFPQTMILIPRAHETSARSLINCNLYMGQYVRINPFRVSTSVLTLSLPCLLLRKRPVKITDLKSLGPFSLPSQERLKGFYFLFLSECAVLKVNVLQDHQIYCLGTCMCRTSGPGNFTSWSSEGVKMLRQASGSPVPGY